MIATLAKRSATYLSGLLTSRALSVIAFILYARVLLPEKFGEFIFFVTLIQTITFFADFGLVQWFQKESHNQKNREKIFTQIIQARLFTLIVSLFISYAIVTATGFSTFKTLTFLFLLIPEAFLSILDGYYLAQGKPGRVGLKTGLRMSIYLIGLFIFYNKFSLENAILLYIAGSFISLAILFPWNTLRPFSLFMFSKTLTMLKKSSAFALLIATSFAYSRGDALVIGYLLGNAPLGIYSSAYRFLEGLNMIPTAVAHNLFPLSSKESRVSFGTAKKILRVMFVIGIFASTVLFLTSDWLVPLVLGSSYSSAVSLVRIFALVVFLFFINSPISTIVQSSKYLNRFLPYGILNTVVNVGLNLLLVPAYGLTAAAWIMVGTELLGLGINLYFLKKVYSV